MMSKNSFLASLKENNKRRIWLWLVSSLLWFFFYPVGMALMMSRKKNHNLIDGLTGAAAKNRLLMEAGNWLSANGLVAFLVSLMAVICAIQGFSYLYSRKKVDLYHSVPVKKSRRFAVIYLNGILIYLIPNIIGMGLAILVASINGAMNGNIFRSALVAVGLNLLLCLGTYGLAVLAVMLTGNLIIKFFAVCVLLGYEAVIRFGYILFQSEFYDYFYYNYLNLNVISSPLGQYIRILEKMELALSCIGMTAGYASSLGNGFLLAVIFLGMAYLCYYLRPSEAAGKTMAFACTKSIIKFLITVPFTLMVTFMVKNIVGDGNSSATPVIFTMLVVAVLANCIMEVIYEADIRAALRKKYQILISGACVAVIYCIFCFDLTGFDAWVPEAEELEDAVVICLDHRYRNFYDENLNYVDAEEIYMSKPGVKDLEAVCELSKRKCSELDDCIWLTMAYRMKNGKTIWREFPVSGEETEWLNRIIGSDEYKAATYQLTDEAVYEGIKARKIEEITYDTGFRVENLPVESLDELREAYKKDLEQVDYSTYREEFACGMVNIIVLTEGRSKRAWFEYTVYPSYENTIALLKEKGVYSEEYLNVEEVASITVTNYHHDLQEKAYEAAMEGGNSEEEILLQMGSVDMEVHKTFTGEEQIRELAAALYPMNLPTGWKAPETISSDYYVTVQYKDGARENANYRGSNEAQLITKYIPSWLEAETAYK